MKRFIKIISSFLLLSILFKMVAFNISVSAFEFDVTDFAVVEYLNLIVDSYGDDTSVDMLGYYKALGSTHDSGCSSSDGFHHWGLASDYTISAVMNSFHVRCMVCGMHYIDYTGCAVDEEGSLAYDNYVSSLPSTTYSSDGSIYVIPRIGLYDFGPPAQYRLLNNGETDETSSVRQSLNLPLFRHEVLKSYYNSSSSWRLGVCMEYNAFFRYC